MQLNHCPEVAKELFSLRADVCAAGFRLFTLVPTQQEVKDLLDHVDSPYIRAVRILTLTLQ